jgi:hypothetical protein
MGRHLKRWAWVWGTRRPAFSVGYTSEKLGPGDSGYTVLYDDAPAPEELDEQGQHPDVSIVCLCCLIDDDPDLGRGLDIAREYGVADLDDGGEWVVGDLSRLEPVCRSATKRGRSCWRQGSAPRRKLMNPQRRARSVDTALTPGL